MNNINFKRKSYEVVWWIISLAILTTSFIIGIINNWGITNYFFYFGGVAGITSVLLVAKGKRINVIFGIAECILVAVGYLYFGKYLLAATMFILPVFISMTWVYWKPNYEVNKMVESKTMSIDYALLNAVAWLALIGAFFAINAITPAYNLINTDWLSVTVDAIAAATILIAINLMMRRYSLQWIFWIITDLTFIVLSTIGLTLGNTSYSLTMILLYVCYLVNAVYGYLVWKKII